MTESEWLASEDVVATLKFNSGTVTQRLEVVRLLRPASRMDIRRTGDPEEPPVDPFLSDLGIWRLRPVHPRVLADYVRCLIPYQPFKIKPAWLTSTVVALAKGIRDDQAFDRMPVLADALQDAGCREMLVTHCRAAVHVRRCFVIDRLLRRPR